jgi:hypothetical protein
MISVINPPKNVCIIIYGQCNFHKIDKYFLLPNCDTYIVKKNIILKKYNYHVFGENIHAPHVAIILEGCKCYDLNDIAKGCLQ